MIQHTKCLDLSATINHMMVVPEVCREKDSDCLSSPEAAVALEAGVEAWEGQQAPHVSDNPTLLCGPGHLRVPRAPLR